MKSDLITPKALACDYVEYVWVTHHYGAKAGKFIGSWPRSARKNDTERMRALKDKYGFSYIGFGYAQSVFNRALSVDFSKENIMIGINDQNWQSTINTVQSVYGNIYGYYLDEPIYHEYNPDCGYIIKSYLVNNSYSSLFLTGDFKRIWPLGWIVENADKVLFTAYTKWWLLFGFWVSCCPWNPDQRSNWTDFRSSFGTKFSSTWVGAHKDLSEYDLLLGHAQNLNLDGVWLYQSQDITDDYDDNNVSEFSYSAWRHGFLRKWVQDVKLTWRCTITNPCGCDPICFPEHYYLYSIEYGTTIKEVFP